MLKQSYLSQKYDLEEMIQRKYPQQIKECKETIENLKQDNQYLKDNTTLNADNFSPMKIDNQIYNERAKAGEKILEMCKKINDTKGIHIGDYRGFKMYLEFNTFEKVFQVALKNIQTYRTTLGSDKVGVITRINNTLESIEKMIENNIQKLQNLELQCKNAQETLEIPFGHEQELQESLARLKEVNKLLKIGETKEREVIDIVDEENDEIEEYSKREKREYVR